MLLEIVTPDFGKVFEGEVSSVYFPGYDGEFGVMDGHCDLLSLLNAGIIEINTTKENYLVAISWGYVKVSDSRIDVLANNAKLVRGDSSSSLALAIEEAKKILTGASTDQLLISPAILKLETMNKA